MTSVPTPRPGPLRLWLQGWQHLVFLVLDLATGLAALTVALCILVGALGLVAAGSGLVLLVPAMWTAWWFGRFELGRIEVFTGHRITPETHRPEPVWVNVLGVTRLHRRVAAYTFLHALWGVLAGTLMASLTALAVALLAMPLYAWRIPDSGLRVLWVFDVDTTPGQVIAWASALVLFILLPVMARVVSSVDITLARTLLGVDPDAEIAHLSERVETLTQSREETVDSVESERRRIERDLHDGPQQRLVAIAMDLGMARERMTKDPEGARELLDQAHLASKEAIVEMRQVARGITPPILADRGLGAAASALAARSPVPVRIEADGLGRLDPTTEAIAYFCVSELLTNVAKHARARQAEVRLSRPPGDGPPRLVVEVLDDGVGGAAPGRGTGLVGLRQRVTAVDGAMQVSSPDGGPTHVTITLPERPTRPLRSS